MSKKIVSTLAGLILLLAAASVQARSTLSNQMQVTVPFEFAVNGKTLPAGVYVIELNTERGTILLSTDGQQPIMLLAMGKESLAAPKRSKLVFHRYGTSFFLTEVWTGGSTTGRALAISDREKELASKNGPKQEIVVEAPLPLAGRS
jgi:hypothetical protein